MKKFFTRLGIRLGMVLSLPFITAMLFIFYITDILLFPIWLISSWHPGLTFKGLDWTFDKISDVIDKDLNLDNND